MLNFSNSIALNMELDTNEPNSAERVTFKDVYFHSVVMSPKSVRQFQFYQDTSVTTGSDRYIFLAGNQSPDIYYVKGNLTHLSVTADGAVKSRKLHAIVDEYKARLKI